jgi:hypothetical protein
MRSEFQRYIDFEHHFPDVRKMVPRRRFADHFVGVRKMVPARLLEMNAEARELEGKIAENVVELLEA